MTTIVLTLTAGQKEVLLDLLTGVFKEQEAALDNDANSFDEDVLYAERCGVLNLVISTLTLDDGEPPKASQVGS